MKRATRDILYFETGPDNEPTLHVSPGEEFEVESQLNRVPWLDDHPDGDSLRKKLRAGNPSSGCIYVDGAEPGQTLIVHIGEIDLDPIGFTSFRGANGAMPGWLGGSGIGAHHKVVEIKDRQILWSDSLKIPVARSGPGQYPLDQRLGRPVGRQLRHPGGHDGRVCPSAHLRRAPCCTSVTCTPARAMARSAAPVASRQTAA